MKQIDLREGARRQHRALALFATIQCWMNKSEGVAFEREQLQRLLGLERFKKTRVDWLTTDLQELFPHVKAYRFTRAPTSLSSMFVSRVPISKRLPKGSMTTKERLAKMSKTAPKIALFTMWKVPSQKELQSSFEGVVPFFADSVNYDERFLSAYLALLAQGQISPRALP
jgi:hypothetical protein